ncbi:MAG: hypothetical protein UU82_C0015G0015 [Candidatus Nomurabacteria bacterium GW2011_GWC2_41_8]|uniref:Uncharacterized protein n=2 Tax=Candidatus Nomuraibacteriota TaxID=1752729 RepID=A0A1F6YC60_9BACT|nr:MAG: hypothetical protein UU82_C0015G0015 [Candidatus Nomurabacteria bacterium GW2011_GWC2_41_8]OGI66884.1 MAG: hypothetical protein A2823_01260 [Candidatus Nomurabacteria bacterium RIFCSPHIGHO2_01_FULL_41_91]OGI80595.1 MAG: hypothetical protein A3D43_02595 [Candidatus Nomurabacteria bacterium RIFCSPHIGHO2_02_FULL_41_52]OGI85240.1 MAG: hypothetical protein A3F49_00955 [Candidatus Nomurabacteria bacterium RIFCSPHIGHO2_12_FULL_42_19]OGI94370.1 MAG: hypothetical protein A3A07_02340 [Candidatus 
MATYVAFCLETGRELAATERLPTLLPTARTDAEAVQQAQAMGKLACRVLDWGLEEVKIPNSFGGLRMERDHHNDK